MCKCHCRNKEQLTLKIVVREAKPTNSIKSTYSSLPIWGEWQSVKQFQAHNPTQSYTIRLICCMLTWLPWPEHLVELQPINLPPLDLLLASLHNTKSNIKCSACSGFLLCCDRVRALCMFDWFSAKFSPIGSYEPLTLADSIFTSRSFLKPRHLSSSQVYNNFNQFICVFRHVLAGIAV